MKPITTEIIIARANKIHKNKYDYSKLEYKHFKEKVTIICPIHGEFYQLVDNHLRGHGCRKCNQKVITYESFIEKTKSTPYEYIFVKKEDFLTKLNSKNKLEILCHKHGIFKQSISHHYNGIGCPHCRKSKGELMIQNYLESNNIQFTPQKTCDDCIGIKRKLPFDFYLDKFNTCIEYNGRQHYQVINRFGGEDSFKKLVYTDKVKKQFCEINNIRLYEISYKENIKESMDLLIDSLIIKDS